MAILSVVRNVRQLRIGVPPSPPALPASFRRLCATICTFTHLSSISFRNNDALHSVNTSSPDYLHNVFLAQLLTRRGSPLASISLESTQISTSNLSLLRTYRSGLKVLKFADALSNQNIPILSLDRPWGPTDTLESLIVSGISMKLVSVLLHRLARGCFRALRKLNLQTSAHYERDLDLPENLKWATPPLHETTLPFANTWFAIKVMQVVQSRALILDPNFFALYSFDFIRFLQDTPFRNVTIVAANANKREWKQVESLLQDRGIMLVEPEEYW